MDNIFRNIDITTKALNAAWKRNEVISNNIANVNTPNFKKSYVAFEELLQDYLKENSISVNTTHKKHIKTDITSIEDLSHKVVTTQNYRTRRDGNNVDIDVEMAESAKNYIVYNTLSTQLNNDVKRIKMVINEGSR